METGLAGDKTAVRDKEMSPVLELWPCHSEGCPDCAVWHQVWLIDAGGHCRWPVTSFSDSLLPELGPAFLQYPPEELVLGAPKSVVLGVAVSWCLC